MGERLRFKYFQQLYFKKAHFIRIGSVWKKKHPGGRFLHLFAPEKRRNNDSFLPERTPKQGAV